MKSQELTVGTKNEIGQDCQPLSNWRKNRDTMTIFAKLSCLALRGYAPGEPPDRRSVCIAFLEQGYRRCPSTTPQGETEIAVDKTFGAEQSERSDFNPPVSSLSPRGKSPHILDRHVEIFAQELAARRVDDRARPAVERLLLDLADTPESAPRPKSRSAPRHSRGFFAKSRRDGCALRHAPRVLQNRAALAVVIWMRWMLAAVT